MMTKAAMRDSLQQLLHTTLAAAMPRDKILPYLPVQPPRGRVVVVGAGKAAASMAAELERVWPYPQVPLSGLVITRYQHAESTRQIEVVEAAHPVPDEAGQAAAARLLASVQGLSADDWVIALVSGGASALMALPQNGLSLADKQAVTRALLHSGAPIEAINTVRKHLSAIKGGRLAAAAAPAQVLTLAISDVVGDDLSVIGSGATVADATTFADVRRIIGEYGITVPAAVQAYLDRAGEADETPKQLPNSQAHVIVTPHQAFQAACTWAQQQGWSVWYLGDRIAGEAREVAQVMAAMALHLKQHRPDNRPVLILSGGETTVTVRNRAGKGGRNTEFLLALALALRGEPGIGALAADTDGIDGSEDNAGAWLMPDTLAQAQALGVDAAALLQANRAYDFFAAIDQLVLTGPTRTNINDFRAVLVC